jgi:hypothetical protein
MKRFLLLCLAFFAIFFILDKALLPIRNAAPKRELDKRLELILTGKINADILVFGSSRGARDIIASEIADSLRTIAYNLSYPGSNIEFHEYLLKKLIQFKNKKPGLIVLAVDDAAEFRTDNTITFRFDRLYPLIKYEDVRNTLIERGEKNKVLCELFIVHQLSLGAFDLRKKHFSEKDTIFNDGSMPFSYQGGKFNRNYVNRHVIYNQANEIENKISSFTNFLKICHDNNIMLLLALAPNFGTPTIGFYERVKKISDKKKFPVMIYDSTKPLYKDPDYFYDAGHLKKNGASVFTSEISAFIRNNRLLE